VERAGGGGEHVEVLYRYRSRHDYGSRFAGVWHDLASFFLARKLEMVVCVTMIWTEVIPDQSSEMRREDIFEVTTSSIAYSLLFVAISENPGQPRRSLDHMMMMMSPPRHQAIVSRHVLSPKSMYLTATHIVLRGFH
jgi:hypothetical protein